MSENNVPQAIAAVMTELAQTVFSEDKRNEQSKYGYVSADQVNRRVQAACGKAGLAVIPSVLEWSADAIEYNRTTKYTTTVQMAVTLATATDSREFMWTGCGIDYGSQDKALYKAYTSGLKYFMLKTFLIGAGDDTADSEHEQPEPKQERQNKPRPVQVEPEPAPDAWEAPVLVSTKSPLFKRFMATGKETYGDEWDDKRPVIVEAVSGKRTKSSAELTVEEIQKLIDGMEAKLAAGDGTLIKDNNWRDGHPDDFGNK